MSNNNPEKLVKAIHRRTRRKYSAEKKIRIVLEGLRGEDSIAELGNLKTIYPELRTAASYEYPNFPQAVKFWLLKNFRVILRPCENYLRGRVIP
jgi:hypothetical protein